MLVSVIIPNYNHEKYLDERIQSILNQTYKDIEIIILDDCSTDKSKAVIEKYRDNRYVSHIIYNENNSGSTFKQWEKGFQLAKGEIVWIAESDDSCNPDFLYTLVPKFTNEHLVLAFSRSMQIDQDGNPFGEYLTQKNMNSDFDVSGQELIRRYLVNTNIVVNASSALIRKDVLSQIDNSYKTFRGCGDWLFWISIAEMGDVSYIAKSMNLFRQHLNNTTSSLDMSGNNPIEVHLIYNYLVEKSYLKGWRRLWFRASRLPSYCWGKVSKSPEVKTKILNVWKFSPIDYFLALLYTAIYLARKIQGKFVMKY